MKTIKSIIDYQKTKRDISSTYTMDESYNEITGNPNKSLQSTETAVFGFIRFDCRNVSAVETCRYVIKNEKR